jgi:hypothetical protein
MKDFKLVLLAVAAVLSVSVLGNKPESSLLKEDGKLLFRKGVSSSGEELTGSWIIGSDKTKASGEQIACASCHGFDGKGLSEAGRVSADISPSVLFKNKFDENGKKIRGQYGINSLYKLLEDGIDPSGKRVSDLMPRFTLSKEQKRSIFSYIKSLDEDNDPGVTDEEIKIALVTKKENLPLIEMVTSFFDRNYRNGIFGRKIRVNVVEQLTAEDITKNYLLAVVDEIGLNKDIEEFLSLNDFIIFSLKDRISDEVSQETPIFTVMPSMMQQGKIAAKYISSLGGSKKVGFLMEKTNLAQKFYQGFDEAFSSELINMAEKENQGKKIDYLLFLSEQNSVESVAGKYKGAKIIAPSTAKISGKTDSVYYIYPNNLKTQESTFPVELSEAARKSNYNLSEVFKLIKTYTFLQVASEAIKSSGRTTSRPKIINLIEKVEIENGVLPKVSFNKNKFGISGAYVIDVKKKTASPWIEP